MDTIKAQALESLLRGKTIDRWTIESLIDNGKSAAVFLASSADGPAAVKIFDDELIERYGDRTQLARIERELELIGKHHDNLVKILGGGVDTNTNNHYIVMAYLDGPNLKKCLSKVPAENLPVLISQLASATQFLERLGYVHRDIKPENVILLENYSKLVLLDLGVLRPIAGSDLTDINGIQAFVGTLQYSSPEFLLREEEDSADGWRALTFYQIGGVLHDLIMRRALFGDFVSPYARLVNAVQFSIPEIQNSAVPYYLVEAARCCLLKDWRKRLKLVTWESFHQTAATNAKGQSAKQRVTNRGAIAQAQLAEVAQIDPDADGLARKKLTQETLDYLGAAARTIRAENSVLPPLKTLPKTPDESCFGICFARQQSFGLLNDVTILIRVEILDSAARALTIHAHGCIGKYAKGKSPTVPPQIVFEGVYDAVAMHEALENCIYNIIDDAQNSYAHLTDSTALIWLEPKAP